MYLLVGLGNPGTKYAFNRHNIGYLIIEKLAEDYKFPLFKKKMKSFISLGIIDRQKVLLVKPSTYMNLSGESLLQIKSFYNVDLDKIFVFHDEIDLKLGEIRIKKGGGHNGHNGLKSIDRCIGSLYHRIRFGVGRPCVEMSQNKNDMVSNWVLSDFTEAEINDKVQTKLNLISNNVISLISNEYETITKYT